MYIYCTVHTKCEKNPDAPYSTAAASSHPCASSSQLLPLVNLKEECAGTGDIHMCRHVCTEHWEIVVSPSLSTVGVSPGSHCSCPSDQRAEAAVQWVGEQKNGMVCALFCCCLFFCLFVFLPGLTAWISWTGSLKATGKVSFKCLIDLLCKRKLLAVFITE